MDLASLWGQESQKLMALFGIKVFGDNTPSWVDLKGLLSKGGSMVHLSAQGLSQSPVQREELNAYCQREWIFSSLEFVSIQTQVVQFFNYIVRKGFAEKSANGLIAFLDNQGPVLKPRLSCIDRYFKEVVGASKIG